MRNVVFKKVVMGVAFVLLCMTTVAQNVENNSAIKIKSETNLVMVNSGAITFAPNPCYVYTTGRVGVRVTLPAGYYDVEFLDAIGNKKVYDDEHYKAEVCIEDNQLTIRVTGKTTGSSFSGILRKTLRVSAIRENPKYNTRNVAGVQTDLEIYVMSIR